jgi:hypothetical protein
MLNRARSIFRKQWLLRFLRITPRTLSVAGKRHAGRVNLKPERYFVGTSAVFRDSRDDIRRVDILGRVLEQFDFDIRAFLDFPAAL